MAAKPAKKAAAKGGSELIISKSRTKAAAKKCNVSREFYGALDKKVRGMIAEAESRAMANKRKTLKPGDL
ncbi:MAG TPA: DUF1931 domain-containing protein [Candidatus Krumholzibacteria bacterium]|jgi:hypothetical protein|nr:DUF1931 domain-containing protein [Candidatus Krumholzibacteria bacterium]